MSPCPAPRAKSPESLNPSLTVMYPLRRKYENGSANIIPRALPHILCAYSIQYMNLKSSMFIPLFTRLYSGDCLYFSNSTNQSSSVRGGRLPVNFQSVIDRPERVSRVIPPSTTILKTQAADAKSHMPTIFRAWGPAVTRNFNPSLFSAAEAATVEIFLKDALCTPL
uniref:Putative ovule protein n=1 Tax=Solanum chacoense TaxID=4108 RepID=A0A0V0HF12_SOLCH